MNSENLIDMNLNRPELGIQYSSRPLSPISQKPTNHFLDSLLLSTKFPVSKIIELPWGCLW